MFSTTQCLNGILLDKYLSCWTWNLPKVWGSEGWLLETPLDFAFYMVSHSSISSWYFWMFCALFRYCCCRSGLLQLPFSAPCQPPQGLVGWPTAAWRSGTWSPSGYLLYCFQPIFCGSHGAAHVQGEGGVKGYTSLFLALEGQPLLNHN